MFRVHACGSLTALEEGEDDEHLAYFMLVAGLMSQLQLDAPADEAEPCDTDMHGRQDSARVDDDAAQTEAPANSHLQITLHLLEGILKGLTTQEHVLADLLVGANVFKHCIKVCLVHPALYLTSRSALLLMH